MLISPWLVEMLTLAPHSVREGHNPAQPGRGWVSACRGVLTAAAGEWTLPVLPADPLRQASASGRAEWRRDWDLDVYVRSLPRPITMQRAAEALEQAVTTFEPTSSSNG